MGFLLSIWTLLVLTLVTLILNFNCWDNMVKYPDRSENGYFYENLFLPEFFYKQDFVETITVVCSGICGVFIFFVT